MIDCIDQDFILWKSNKVSAADIKVKGRNIAACPSVFEGRMLSFRHITRKVTLDLSPRVNEWSESGHPGEKTMAERRGASSQDFQSFLV